MPRRLVVTENLTANGVIEFVDEWFDPGDQGDASDLIATTRELMTRQDALLLGRKTFETFRSYWPLQTDDTTGTTDHLNQVAKYVVSSTMTDPEWSNSTVLSGRLEDEVERLKSGGDGAELGITGSISIVHALMRADLIDEYRLLVYPVLSSRGQNLIPDDLPMHRLTLAEVTTFRSGIALHTYTRTAA